MFCISNILISEAPTGRKLTAQGIALCENNRNTSAHVQMFRNGKTLHEPTILNLMKIEIQISLNLTPSSYYKFEK